MKPICIILARGASKEVLNKNIRILGNKPLIAHAIESALESRIFDHVVVSTDDPRISDIAKQYGAEVPFRRPKQLATDRAKIDDALIHAIKELNSLGYIFKISVMRDCTVPFIDKNDISGAVELLKKSDCDAVFGAIKAHPNPYFGMMEVNPDGYLEISKSAGKHIANRQDAPIVYSTLGLYVHYTKKLLQIGKIVTSKILPYEIPKEHSLMIDFEIDFKVAEFLYNLRKNPKKPNKFSYM